MKLSDFDYNLPDGLIAKEPVIPRDHSRLLVFDRNTKLIEHRYFKDVCDYFRKGDLLILNNSKVIPARLIGKKETDGKVEVFLLSKKRDGVWECLIGGKRVKVGTKIFFDNKLTGSVTFNNEDGTWQVEFNIDGKKFMDVVYEIGRVPLPPYIKRGESVKKNNDRISYQTIYADDKKEGSVAAPTAGLHFTERLLNRLKKKGVEIAYVTLHVGLGTFTSVKSENIKEHKMHGEIAEANVGVVRKIINAKKNKKRVFAVGTTSVRTLEGLVAEELKKKNLKTVKREIKTFIYPGYKFKVVDAVITNFHLPKSTLLMLVASFLEQKGGGGKGMIREIYRKAIKDKYRFYSYGDAMLII